MNNKYIDILKVATEIDNLAIIKKQYSQSIIDDGSKYKLGIDRFYIPCQGIPIFIFDPSSNYYIVTLKYNNISSDPISLIYIPSSNISINNPLYYYVYFFDDMIKMINDALSDAFTSLTGKTVLPVGSKTPYLNINYPNSELNLYTDSSYDEDTSPHIEIYFNSALGKFINGLPVYINYSSLTEKYRLKVYNFGSNVVSGLYCMTSNYKSECIENWNICRGIVIINQGGINTTHELMPSGNNSSEVTQHNSRSILANFDILYENDIKPLKIQYISATSMYKWIDINNDNINKIDLSIEWYDANNNFYPIYMNIGNSISARLVFVKK
jgi:hypothetical protein